MLSYESFTQALLAGLSTGVFCLSSCFPFMATFVAAEERPNTRNLLLLAEFLLGRLIGYLLIGLVFGMIAQHWQGTLLTLLSDIALILASVILLLYLTGLLKPRHTCQRAPQPHAQAFVMGLLMGLRVCPPLLASAAYTLSLHSVLNSVIYFSLFFLASSVYFIPMLFVGMLGRMNELRTVARWSGIVAAIIFILHGAWSITISLGANH